MKGEQEVVKEREVETASQQRGARQGRGNLQGVQREGGGGGTGRGQSSLRKGFAQLSRQ